MKVLILFFTWLLLLAVCWPLAFLALVLAPLIWILSIPFRILFACVTGVILLLKALISLPGRILGGR